MSDKVLTITLMAIAIQLCSDLAPPSLSRKGRRFPHPLLGLEREGRGWQLAGITWGLLLG
jgi:hypothetical protein